jgi:hypothetical protein
MSVLLGAIVGLVGVIVAYRTLRPVTRPDYDAGTVSEYWLGQQRRQPDDWER